MLTKTRLGKRSPFGESVSATCRMAGNHTHLQTGETTAPAAGPQAGGRVRRHPGLKVYFQCGGGESPGRVDQLDLMKSKDSESHPSSSSLPPSSSRCVSSCIDVPRSQGSPQDLDMDELMAALVLSSLSGSPLLHSPAKPEPPAPPMECGGGELSDSSSGYWSVGHAIGSPAPSPPITEPDASPARPQDEGLEMELERFDEPAPRKRRNSVKVAYRCLWPACGKVLTTVVGIKRHIRTTHLCRGSEHERCSRSEEDFYYTEVAPRQSPPQPIPVGPAPSSPTISPAPPSPPPSTAPPSPPSLTDNTLSRSAPSSSGHTWQVQSEHSYQAHVVSEAAANVTSCRWTAPPSTCHSRQGLAFRVRSVSVGEQWLQHQSAPCRRTRGEAKKCRKVYGIEHRDQWCTACRWKKACQRFLD